MAEQSFDEKVAALFVKDFRADATPPELKAKSAELANKFGELGLLLAKRRRELSEKERLLFVEETRRTKEVMDANAIKPSSDKYKLAKELEVLVRNLVMATPETKGIYDDISKIKEKIRSLETIVELNVKIAERLKDMIILETSHMKIESQRK